MHQEVLKDLHIRLLILNTVLVIISYGMATLTDMVSNAIIQPVKSIILLLSLILLLKSHLNKSHLIRENQIAYFFIFFILILSLFSFNVIRSLSRGATFIFPFLYVLFISRYTYLKVGIVRFKNLLIFIFHFIYIIPIVSFYLFGGSFENEDIYGDTIGAFVSNHYGWASIIYILTFYDLWTNDLLGKKYKIIGIILCFSAFYILIISGNRASYLCLLIASIILIIYSQKINIFIKLISAIVVVFIWLFSFELDKESIIYNRLEKTLLQLENAEEYRDTRTTARKAGLYLFDKHPELTITGVGLFNFREALDFYAPEIPSSHYRSGVHNSYFEILFGLGIFPFLYFLFSYTLTPLFNYFKYLTGNLLFPIPLIILPFFESNLTGGQFLFFPWFLTIFLLRFYNNLKLNNIPA